MSETTRPSLRIDWFDGSVIEERRSAYTQNDDQAPVISNPDPLPQYNERKLMGFKRLLDLSRQEAPRIILQLSGRTSFWDLLQTDLKGDYIVVISNILSKLYIYLQSGQTSSILNSLLKNKFITSRFLNSVYKYLIGLPQTKIVDKRMNMLFWENLESFYTNVLDICEGICTYNQENVDKAASLLEATVLSINGVMAEHREQFTNQLNDQIDILNKKVEELMNNEPKAQQNFSTYDFSKLNIFPTLNDIHSTTSSYVEPNIINGAFSSVQHYLDIQFKLLREDYFGPLRDGILKYIENPTERRHENIRVHPKVRIIRSYVSMKKVGYLVDIAWKERLALGSIDKKKYLFNNQLMFGSLLLFTCDNFNTIFCATVLDSNTNLLNEGYIAVSFHTPISSNVFSQCFVMIESEVFFEPYHRVLKVLQDFNRKDIPMSQYIVYLKPETRAPAYLSIETTYSMYTPLLDSVITFPVLEKDNWPDIAHFQLDNSQMEAYKLALTREFAVIQGPPGTGKTFIGIKVASTLLRNLSLEGTPMLVVCYTNHALDQFLEAILKITKNIIRLGSQSKNEKIDPYTLNNSRMKNKSKYSYLFTNKRSEQEKIYKEMMSIQDDIEKCEKEILDYKSVKPFLKIGSKVYELNRSIDEDPILKWLFNKEVPANDDEIFEDWEKEFEEKTNIGNIESIQTCFSNDWALKEIESMKHNLNYVKEAQQDPKELVKMRHKFESQIDKVNNRLDIFKKRIICNNNTLNTEFKQVPDLYSLNFDDRWNLYFKAVSSVKINLLKRMDMLQEKYRICTEELEEVSTLVDGEIVKTARVVGVTTSAAARLHRLLQELRSPIVIIEEAAEVFEAHIVASLTHHCKHLILIGDHKQLRPTAAHYKLAKESNLEISLFERMIRNGIHSTTLTVQRRMRPIFVDLLVPIIYDKLDSHCNVLSYPNVRGMEKNLLFVTHNIFEDDDSEYGWSHKNRGEAEWCIALANYLTMTGTGYTASDITILATYNSQASLIRYLSKKYESLQGCRITVVDNFQGEESRIVILSLVRSNRDGNIGFLAAENRICVALSRAKEGLYIFGNMDVLKSASPIWRSIDNRLKSHEAISDVITISCPRHVNNTMLIKNPEEFDQLVAGECLKTCIISK